MSLGSLVGSNDKKQQPILQAPDLAALSSHETQQRAASDDERPREQLQQTTNEAEEVSVFLGKLHFKNHRISRRCHAGL